MPKRITRIDDLTPDAANANAGTPRGRYMLEQSLRETGAGRSVVADREGRIIAGNKTVEVAEALDLPVRVIETDGRELVVVQRTDLDLTDNADGRARKLAYYDNRAGETGLSWDAAQIAADLEGGLDLSSMFREEELSALMERAADGMLAEADDDYEPPTAGSTGADLYAYEQIIDAAFAYFRATGFPYRNLPIHVCMQEINKLANTGAETLPRTNTAYHVADTYHPHRYHASAEGMKSPVDGFEDDVLLRRAMALALDNGYTLPSGAWGQLWIVSGVQACANFRPGFACYLYRRYAPANATVLDTSTGYGGRLVGFMASGVAGRYIGIDPNKPTHDGNLRMAADLGFADKVELYNLPAEDVPIETVAGRCDFAFTSPPYFAKEHYADDETQSWVRYKTADAWREGFLVPMLRLQYAALKPGCTAIVNIADVKLRNKTYPLEAWAKESAQAVGFQYIATERFELSRRFGAGQEDEVAVEPVIVLRKPGVQRVQLGAQDGSAQEPD